jgi:site-specific DNA recombinase
MRCVIYARYSTDMQSTMSVEDQFRICRAKAEKENWEVVDTYGDHAITGQTTARPEYMRLLVDARAGRFDVVLSESLDRLSRDNEHLAGFYKKMVFARVRVVTLMDGDVNDLHIAFKGAMSASSMKDLRQKTRRGLEGRVRAGCSGGGLSYAYRVRRGFRADGTPITGELEVEPKEAAIVRRIFESYVAGQSPRSIAVALNSEAVPGPRGGHWTASLLLGGAARETGLLRNRLYVGERVWNRQRWDRDPQTDRRVARPNPPETWVITQVPDLAILEPELWHTAQRRLEAGRRIVASAAPENHGNRLVAARRPRSPLAGLIRCGLCEGLMSVMGCGGRLGCSNHVERGTCTNPRTVLRDKVVKRVLVGLKERLLAPELVQEFVSAYVSEVNAANRARGSRRASLQGEAAKLDRQIRNLLDLIKDGHGSPTMVAELREIERRREALSAEISAAATPEPVPEFHASLPELYRQRVEALEEALADPATVGPATEALRSLIDAIVVVPGDRRGEISLTLRGDLAAFLRAGEGDRGEPGNGKTPVRFWASRGSGEVLGSWDAGTGFEPVTFRL